SGRAAGASRPPRTGPTRWTPSATRSSAGSAPGCRGPTPEGPADGADGTGRAPGRHHRGDRRGGRRGAGGGAGRPAGRPRAGLPPGRSALGRYRRGPDPEVEQPFGRLPTDRQRTVQADDGTPLHVEEIGPPDAALTVVFAHGYVNSLGTWHYQRLGLADVANP